jgi:hypothetical protein
MVSRIILCADLLFELSRCTRCDASRAAGWSTQRSSFRFDEFVDLSGLDRKELAASEFFEPLGRATSAVTW